MLGDVIATNRFAPNGAMKLGYVVASNSFAPNGAMKLGDVVATNRFAPNGAILQTVIKFTKIATTFRSWS